MDSQEMEQIFDTIKMALLHGYPHGAQKVFNTSIQKAVNNKLDQVVSVVEKSGAFYLIEEIKELKLI